MMKRGEAIRTIEEMFELDSLGIGATMSDEQIEAVKMALFALKHPDRICCGSCETFGDEESGGDGWCYWHDRFARCDDKACPSLILRKGADDDE